MKALERIGVIASVLKTAECRIARYRLAEVVGEFVADRLRQEPRPPLSPVAASKQYQQVLAVLCKHPDSWFTVNELTSKLIRVWKCARRPTAELHAAGYLLRRLSDGGRPGRTVRTRTTRRVSSAPRPGRRSLCPKTNRSGR